MRAYRRFVLALTLILSAVCVLSLPAGLILHAAPAPWPRKAKPPATIPAECVMWWGQCAYHTAFRSGGGYEARPCGAPADGLRWVGVWWIEDREGRRVLHIRETTRPEDPDSYIEYRIWLTPCLRTGKVGCETGGFEFRLEER